ncbi:MAG: hypothetical protein M1833_003263 [Piccolia ochrophora]|nr:MAG: hypothetical protein M1833_003263 [Piccolia ochrophora]
MASMNVSEWIDPPSNTEFPPRYPPRPNLYNEVEWGPLPTAEDYELAYNAWRLPYETLEIDAETRPYPPGEVLIRHILDHFRNRYYDDVPDPTIDKDAQTRPGGQGGWTGDEVGSPNAHVADEDVLYQGKKILDDKNFTVPLLLNALKMTKKDQGRRKKADLQRLLVDQERTNQEVRLPALLPREDFPEWKIMKKDKFTIPQAPGKLYDALELYTLAVSKSPYNPTYWIARAFLFYQRGEYDLALGDAYRALSLTEVITDVNKRAKRPGLNPRIIDAVEQHVVRAGRSDPTVQAELVKNQGVPTFVTPIRKAYQHIIACSLYALEAYHDYLYWEMYFDKGRLIMDDLDANLYKNRYAIWSQVANKRIQERNDKLDDGGLWEHEVDMGFIEAYRFPQEGEFWDRTDAISFPKINEDYLSGWSKGAPNLIICSVDGMLPEFTVMAKENIPANTIVYAAEPNIRAHWERYLNDKESATEFKSTGSDFVDKLEDFWHHPGGGGGKITNQAQFEALKVPPVRRCENCRRKIPWDEINEARLTHKGILDGTRIGPSKHCDCLFKDPMLYFCTSTQGQRTKAISARGNEQEDDQGVDEGDPDEGGPDEGDPDEGGPSDGEPDDEGQPEAATTGQKRGRPARTRAKDPRTKRQKAASGSALSLRGGAAPKKKKAASKKKGKATIPAPGVATPEVEAKLPETCMDIARALYHSRACGRDWRWLHEGMRTLRVIWSKAEEETKNVNYARHGTILCLLLREVIDMTLMRRQEERDKGDAGRHHILAHEIEAMMPLLGGTHPKKRKFAFGWAANIAVPFDILECLGINIYKDLDFDTWVLQTVLQRLAINVLPWDHRRRGDSDAIVVPPDGADVPFCDLYVHTGFALFNHSCNDSHDSEAYANARFEWVPDSEPTRRPRNMIIVRTLRDIEQYDLIKVCYVPEDQIDDDKAERMFGRTCHCKKCYDSD